MAASYPGSVKSFTNKSAGQSIEAEHINSIQDEVNAIEAGLLNGTAPLTSSRTIVGALSGGASTLASLIVSGALQAVDSTMARLTLSSAAPATPGAHTLYRNTIVKAYGVIDGSQGLAAGGFNIAAVSSNGSTSCDVQFTTAIGTSNYVVSAIAHGSSGWFFIRQRASTGFTLASGGAWTLMNFTVIG